MSKISPLQAEALGLKQAAATKAPIAKPLPAKTPNTLSGSTKTTMPAKPATKPAVKPVLIAKPKTNSNKKESKKDDHKKNHKQDNKTEDKKIKVEKVKMERDSFTMPKDEYAQLTLLKARLTAMGQPAKKSELLRAGIKLLATMSDNTLKTTLAKIPVIKTGRPNKKG
jgi:hypothetical protein